MNARHYRGLLGYISLADGKENGREWFSGTVFDDGTRTHRAVCELVGPWDVTRDVTVSTDQNALVTDCFVRLRHGGRFEGSAMFNFHDDHLECVGNTQTFGQIHQKIPYESRPRHFTCHAVSCDGWVAAVYDHTSDQKRQVIPRAVHVSPTPDGSTGPLAALWDVEVEYRGEVEITVPAGTFVTEHYHWGVPAMPWAFLDSYVFGPQKQLARLTWETLNHTFDLLEYETFD